MIQICRAEDGHVFQVRSRPVVSCCFCLLTGNAQVNSSLRDIERLDAAAIDAKSCSHRLCIDRIGSLELFLHQETGVEQDAILAYLADGRRLTNTNVRELAGSHDQVHKFTLLLHVPLIIYSTLVHLRL